MSTFYDLVKRERPIPADGDSKDRVVLKALTKEKGSAQLVGSLAAPCDKEISNENLVDVLNALLPPREFDYGGKSWVQYTSPNLGTRRDVIALQEQLDEALRERQARHSGLCSVREDLYSQMFDELIRQVTVRCPERGFLLLKVRDELRMTVSAYQTLYQTSVSFGQRKSSEAEFTNLSARLQLSKLNAQCANLRSKERDLLDRLEIITSMQARESAQQKDAHLKEIGRLTQQRRYLQTFLEDNGVELEKKTAPNVVEAEGSS